MAFDATKVQFSQEELARIEDADNIFETVHPAIADGLDWSDFSVIALVFAPIKRVAEWLMKGTKVQLGYKLIALGTGLIRDNEFLGPADSPVE